MPMIFLFIISRSLILFQIFPLSLSPPPSLSAHSHFLFPLSPSFIVLSQCRSATGMGGMCGLFCALLAACCVNIYFFYIPPLTSHPSSSSQPHRLFGPPSLRGGDWPCLQLKNTRSHVPLPLIAMSVRRYSSAAHTGMPDLLASFALWKCSVFSDSLKAMILPNRLPEYTFLPPSLIFKACVWFLHAVIVLAFKIIQNGCATSKVA